MAHIHITAHEIAKGPQGFPTVTYDLAIGDTLYIGATPNDAKTVLLDNGLTENGAARAMHDARDYGSVSYDLHAQATEIPDRPKLQR